MSTTGPSFVNPDLTEADLQRAEELLGVTFDPPRREVLLCNESIDVQACPGSGKTTLLVAKLAILASKWVEPQRGICVLSHTNVARQEVERKLSKCAIGQRLLAYPHFVGTIHGFVDEFLALPWLRSKGTQIRTIDDEICGAKCRALLYSDPKYKTAREFLRQREQHAPNRTITNLRFEGPELALGSAADRLPCGENALSFSHLLEIKERVAEQGYWRYDDMFALAEQLLHCNPKAAELIRARFPVVFLDEMQDTSEMQNRILAMVFPAEACTLRQRFGDTNQAIYEWGQAEATTDAFPSPQCVREIPNSMRFGPSIASLAAPLAFHPINAGLAGHGPPPLDAPKTDEVLTNTILLFEPDHCQDVLAAFGGLLLDSFSDVDLRSGHFRAIGHTGKAPNSADNRPRSLCDYWAAYQPDLSRQEPHPATLADFLFLAVQRRHQRGDAAEAVDLVAKGLIELLYRVTPWPPRRRMALHRWIEARLLGHQEQLATYRKLVWQLCVSGEPPSKETWNQCVEGVQGLLVPLGGEGWSAEARDFCEWSDKFAGQEQSGLPSVPTPANIFRYVRDSRSVDIEVGTIHGAKGQTHRATLVLETFFKKHDLTDLVDWLAGHHQGWSSTDGRERGSRLRCVFTAMTRPTHLLCLALRREALGPNLDTDSRATTLRERGWYLSVLGP